MGVLSKAKTFFDTLFKRHLFATNATLAIGFIGLGDYIQQSIEKRSYPGKSYDLSRTKNMAIVGAGYGVAGHYWYKFLDWQFPGASRKIILKKLLCEAAAGPPLLLAFFLSLGALEKKPMNTSMDDFKENFIVICLADWGVYLPFQAVNFYYLPPRYRFVYVMVLMLVYDVFLSYILHKEDNKRVHSQKCSNQSGSSPSE